MSLDNLPADRHSAPQRSVLDVEALSCSALRSTAFAPTSVNTRHCSLKTSQVHSRTYCRSFWRCSPTCASYAKL